MNLRQFFIVTLILCPQFAFAQDDSNSEKTKNNANNSYREIIYNVNRSSDPKNTTRPDWATGNYFKLTISPQKFSYPILKHRLNVSLSFIEYENAYPFYVEAKKEFDKVKNERLRICWQSEEYRKLDKNEFKQIRQLEYDYFPLYMSYYLTNGEVVRVSADKEAEIYDKLSHVYKLLEKGSRSRYYKWGDKNDLNGIVTTLPFIDYVRELERYLASKADWEIRNGKYDEATKTIRVGLAFGDHIINSAPSTLVSILVGVAINGTMHRQILHLIGQSNSPNLYPELTQIRRNVKALTDGINAEENFIFFKPIRPEIWDNYDNLSAAESKQIVEQLADLSYFGGFGNNLLYNLSYDEFCQKNKINRSRMLSVFCAFSYQPAKERLRERGMSDEKINSLSIYQVIAPYAIEKIAHAYGLMKVSITMQSSEISDSKIFTGSDWVEKELILFSSVDVLLRLFLPALGVSRKSMERLDQIYNLIKIIEAIRYYVAVHDGKLPESLDAIKDVPISKNCLTTGKPYVYKVEGKTITIDYTNGYNKSKLDSRLELVVE
ncbi:MAG: hypothetical protein LBP59_01590 [Planctomycetaceae bacterium]|jgi:hypothetical protein|nr:hypothetical protein [Planctomycetaceae bacterium]